MTRHYPTGDNSYLMIVALISFALFVVGMLVGTLIATNSDERSLGDRLPWIGAALGGALPWLVLVLADRRGTRLGPKKNNSESN
jgi:hypothetical protein